MKKTLKTILTILSAVALVVAAVPSVAKAEVAKNTAFLSFADAAWTYQYWGEAVDTGVTAVNAEVDGLGQYTVSVDFTGTADGKANGVAFIAPMIQGGQSQYPDYVMRIDSVQINGSDIALTDETYTSCDADGKDQLRVNLYNTWVGENVNDAKNFPRTEDGTIEGASAVVVNPDDFVDMETLSVTFSLIDPNASEATTDAEATTDVPKTGVIGLGIVYGLGALATGSVVLKKKK